MCDKVKKAKVVMFDIENRSDVVRLNEYLESKDRKDLINIHTIAVSSHMDVTKVKQIPCVVVIVYE